MSRVLIPGLSFWPYCDYHYILYTTLCTYYTGILVNCQEGIPDHRGKTGQNPARIWPFWSQNPPESSPIRGENGRNPRDFFGKEFG